MVYLTTIFIQIYLIMQSTLMTKMILKVKLISLSVKCHQMKRKEYQSNDDNDVRIEDTLSVEEENKEEADSNDGNEMKRSNVTFAPDTFTSSSSLVINKKIQGLINRLNESNIQSIFKSMEELYKEDSQRGTLLLLLCYEN